VGELIRRLVKLPIGQPRSRGDDGSRAGTAGRLPGEPLMSKPGIARVRTLVTALFASGCLAVR
jgi:hypothetical protein